MADSATAQLPRKFSPSALGMYEECPKQFEFAYLLRPEVEEALSPHLVVGNAVHEALAFLYRLPVEERSESALHQALRHFGPASRTAIRPSSPRARSASGDCERCAR